MKCLLLLAPSVLLSALPLSAKILGTLKQNYKLISEEKPFVGDKIVHSQSETTTVKIQGRHLDFIGTVWQVSDHLISAIKKITGREKNKKDQTKTCSLRRMELIMHGLAIAFVPPPWVIQGVLKAAG